MEVKMTKKVITLTIIIILGMIVFMTAYKVYKNHNAHLILVVEKEFVYQSTLCHKKNICQEIVTLKDLYEAGFMKDKLSNPITKEYYQDDSYVNLNTLEINLYS